MRRAEWPPSRPSASRPSWSRSKTTPRACRSRTAAGASSTRTCTAAGRQRPRPAAIVSSAWRAGESPGSSAAASPPCAQKLALWESGVRETRQTRPPCSAARRAVQSPAAPPPTTTTSYSATAAICSPPSRRIASMLLAQPGGGAFAGAGPLVGDRPLGLGGAALGGLDPLLGGVGLRLDLAQPLFGGGDRPLLGLALLGCSSSSWRSSQLLAHLGRPRCASARGRPRAPGSPPRRAARRPRRPRRRPRSVRSASLDPRARALAAAAPEARRSSNVRSALKPQSKRVGRSCAR